MKCDSCKKDEDFISVINVSANNVNFGDIRICHYCRDQKKISEIYDIIIERKQDELIDVMKTLNIKKGR